MDPLVEELERICGNCNYCHPAEPGGGEFAICLHDPEFDPYMDDILDRQDHSRCQHLIERKNFGWENPACPHFDPIEDMGIELSPAVGAKLEELRRKGPLTADDVQHAIMEDVVDSIDWKNAPVNEYVDRLAKAGSFTERVAAVNRFGWLISQGNKAAFAAMARYLTELPPPSEVDDCRLREEILRQLTMTREFREEVAHLLVNDLMRTPSNRTTRGWYTAVFKFFERSPTDLAEMALRPMLESNQYSYRIKQRVKRILGDENDSW